MNRHVFVAKFYDTVIFVCSIIVLCCLLGGGKLLPLAIHQSPEFNVYYLFAFKSTVRSLGTAGRKSLTRSLTQGSDRRSTLKETRIYLDIFKPKTT